MVLEKTLESALDSKEIQPVHPKQICPGCSLEGLMVKLKLQYFGHLMRRVDSLEKTMMLGGIGSRRRRGRQRMRWLDGITDQWAWVWVNSGSLWWTGRPGVLRFMGSQRVGHDWVTELNWTDNLLISDVFYILCLLEYNITYQSSELFSIFFADKYLMFLEKSMAPNTYIRNIYWLYWVIFLLWFEIPWP